VRTIFLLLAATAMVALPLISQESSGQMQMTGGSNMESMPGMQMGPMSESPDKNQMTMPSDSFIEFLQSHSTSGTDAEPNSTPSQMLMTSRGNWTFMLHGVAFLNYIQQTGPRGADKLFSTNWIMPMAERKVGPGTLTLRTMLSLEPATISERRYPELFQVGETAYGRPLTDAQHPHNFFMELAASYEYMAGENTMLCFYAAPVGDPAMGPAAFPHRASAAENPIGPLGHHFEDSTHIADDVITAGITHGMVRLEASGFHGREPDEFRWDIDSGKIDSWSTRVTVNPGQNWSAQYSIAQLHSPEAFVPAEDIRRLTASVIYNRPLRNGNWATTLIWGRNQSLMNGDVGNAYLTESTVQFFRRNFAWTRIENVDRTNELLLGDNPIPVNFTERYIGRIQAYTLGYDRDIGNIPHLSTALGAQVTWYGVPQILQPLYNPHPAGVVVFLRVRAY
jgi:hypothetical protein